ncbi:phage holin family protein [Marilutibacter alkalisoli]|uniref:phage holin family protein n=1 Tax=Marilutibacter alkalisoli TaxID=2591633 RepID=UPI001FC9EC0D|nr:phage holin family protein [Lysobacter alkalisoli]
MSNESTRPEDGQPNGSPKPEPPGPDSPGQEQGANGETAKERAGFEQAMRDIGGAGRESLGAAADAARALRGLLLADLSLARSALGHALAWMGVALAFGAAACLLAMGAVIALLQALGLSWLASLSITAATSIAVTALGVWMVLRYLRHTSLEATRRQLRRMGLGDETDGADEDGLAGNDMGGTPR